MGITTAETGRNSSPGTAVALVVNGETDRTDGFTSDGVDVKKLHYNIMTLVPSPNAIAEFKRGR